MSIAERYLKEQLSSEEFRRSYLEEKMKLDIEYRLEDLKKAIQKRKSPDELIERVENLEKLVMGA
ncbi:MAG: hypothetical protein ABSF52_17095 [Syntrophobacteraceae bacterium]|jgi:polyhydroxyalkanoate synthesis regulator phasin